MLVYFQRTTERYGPEERTLYKRSRAKCRSEQTRFNSFEMPSNLVTRGNEKERKKKTEKRNAALFRPNVMCV
jgi:hypothetical protein